MTGDRSWACRVAPGLEFCFDDLPGAYAREFARYLQVAAGSHDAGATSPLRVGSGQPPPAETGTELDLEGVRIRRGPGLVIFDWRGTTAWVDAAQERAGLRVRDATESPRELTHRVLAPLLMELAVARGFYGAHAAAIAHEGRAVLLPGESGAGKSTLFQHARGCGFDLLSDDLVWLHESEGGFDVFPFPRGGFEAHPPTVASARLALLVVPEVAHAERHVTEPLATLAATQALLQQGGFLSLGAPSGRKFEALVRAASSVPCFTLRAGPPESAPLELRRLLDEAPG